MVSPPGLEIFGTAFSRMAIEALDHNLLAIPLIFDLLQQTLFIVFARVDLEFFTLHLGNGITFEIRLPTRAHPILVSSMH